MVNSSHRYWPVGLIAPFDFMINKSKKAALHQNWSFLAAKVRMRSCLNQLPCNVTPLSKGFRLKTPSPRKNQSTLYKTCNFQKTLSWLIPLNRILKLFLQPIITTHSALGFLQSKPVWKQMALALKHRVTSYQMQSSVNSLQFSTWNSINSF